MMAVRRNLRATFASLEVRNFRLFFAGQVVSVSGIVARASRTAASSSRQPAKLVGWKFREAVCARHDGTDATA